MNTRKIITDHWFIGVIIFLAAFLRLWHLGEHPIHLTNDEAAIGYNAYSILRTGRDEHGELLPIIFKSFGDWKPGLYIYVTVPSILIFGLTEFAVRFPSALAGIFSVVLVYVISKKLFSEKVALFAALSLAISPWHIHFSRGGWEANLALALLLAAIWLFFESFKNHKALVLSAVFFALTLWTYQSAKAASVLVLIALVLVYRKKLLIISKKYLGASFVLGLLLSIPVLLSLFGGKSGRLEVMSVFSYTRPEEYIQETILDHKEIGKNGLTYLLFHSEAFNMFREVSGRYLNYFSGKFLFFEGDWSSLRHSSPNVGYLLFAEIPALLLGIHRLFRSKNDKGNLFFLLWLALAPIPAALTRDSVHGVRALNLVVPISLALGVGIVSIYENIRKIKIQIIKIASIVAIASMYIYSMAIYLDAYYVQNAYVNAENYFYGYREVVKELDETGDSKKIIFNQSFDQSYIFFLFYRKYEPAIYQKNHGFIEGVGGDVGFVEKLDNIEFRQIGWSVDKMLEDTIIVGKPEIFPMEEIEKQEDYETTRIKYPDGKDAFLIVEPI